MTIDESIAKAKAEVRTKRPGTPTFWEACRKLWELEDSKARSGLVQRISAEIARAKTVRL